MQRFQTPTEDLDTYPQFLQFLRNGPFDKMVQTFQDFSHLEKKKKPIFQRNVPILFVQTYNPSPYELEEEDLKQNQIQKERCYDKILDFHQNKVNDMMNEDNESVRNLMREITYQQSNPFEKSKDLEFLTKEDKLEQKQKKLKKKNFDISGSEYLETIMRILEQNEEFLKDGSWFGPQTKKNFSHFSRFQKSVDRKCNNFLKFLELTFQDKVDNVFLYPDVSLNYFDFIIHPAVLYLSATKIYDKKNHQSKQQDKNDQYEGKVQKTTFINFDGFDSSINWNLLHSFNNVQIISVVSEKLNFNNNQQNMVDEIIENTQQINENDFIYSLHCKKYKNEEFSKYRPEEKINQEEFFFIINEILDYIGKFQPRVVMISYSYLFFDDDTYLPPEVFGYLIRKLQKLSCKIIYIPRQLKTPITMEYITIQDNKPKKVFIHQAEPNFIIYKQDNPSLLIKKYEKLCQILEKQKIFQHILQKESLSNPSYQAQQSYILNTNINIVKGFFTDTLGKSNIGKLRNFDLLSLKSMIFQLDFIVQQRELATYVIENKNSLNNSNPYLYNWTSGESAKTIEIKDQILKRGYQKDQYEEQSYIIKNQVKLIDTPGFSDESYFKLENKDISFIEESRIVYFSGLQLKNQTSQMEIEQVSPAKKGFFFFNIMYKQKPFDLTAYVDPNDRKLICYKDHEKMYNNFILCHHGNKIFLVNASKNQEKNLLVIITIDEQLNVIDTAEYKLSQQKTLDNEIFRRKINYTAVYEPQTQKIICIGGSLQGQKEHIIDNNVMIISYPEIHKQDIQFQVRCVSKSQILPSHWYPSEYPIVYNLQPQERIFLVLGGVLNSTQMFLTPDNYQFAYLLQFLKKDTQNNISTQNDISIQVQKVKIGFNPLGISSKQMFIMDSDPVQQIVSLNTCYLNEITEYSSSKDGDKKKRFDVTMPHEDSVILTIEQKKQLPDLGKLPTNFEREKKTQEEQIATFADYYNIQFQWMRHNPKKIQYDKAPPPEELIAFTYIQNSQNKSNIDNSLKEDESKIKQS